MLFATAYRRDWLINLKLNSNFKLTKMALVIMSSLTSQCVLAGNFVFNPNALEIDNPSDTSIDLSRFSVSGNQMPGYYHVDIYVNGELQDTRNIEFVLDQHGKLVPKINPEQLEKWGVLLSSQEELMRLQKDTVITDISAYIPQAKTDFDFQHQALKFSIPQASMKTSAQGYVDPKYWDEGIPALLMSYSFSGQNSWMDAGNGTSDSYFLNLNSGVNIAGWRLRNYSTWTYNKNNSNNFGSTEEETDNDDGATSTWDSINTYAQHDIQSIKGQFIAGDSYSPSDVFDSIQFRGAQLASDENMLPDSLRGFAPTVRGIANSNAQITVKQNGSIIYQTYVSPGAFVIDDLYPTTSSGDLQVIIKEADGSERTFIQPFSNVPVMQRDGHLKYDVMVGKYRSSGTGEEPVLSQATLIYGLPHDMTVYGGFQASDDYDAVALGAGLSLGDMGSVSLDVTQSYASVNDTTGHDENKNGQSYRFQYSKDIQETDSTITLAGYRYSTKGFYTFQETMDSRDFDEDEYEYGSNYNKRSKIQIDFSQNLMGGQWGSLSFSGYQQDYWGQSGYERNASASYNNSFGNGISWSLMYTYSSAIGNDSNDDQQLAFNVNIPLTQWLPNVYMTANTSNDMHGKSTNQVGLSGTALEGNNLSYNISQGFGNRGEGHSGDMGADYKGGYGEVNAGYNYNDETRQVHYGAQGSMIVHEHGITFGQPMQGDMVAAALVEVPGAADVALQNGTGVRTDWRGYTIVPYLSPYKRTRIALDPESFDDDIDLAQNVMTVTPTSGAIVAARFKANIGKRTLMTLMNDKGFIPFGTIVAIDGSDNNTGIVGEEGKVYLSGIQPNGRLTANWGSQQCHANFNLPDDGKTGSKTLTMITLKCI